MSTLTAGPIPDPISTSAPSVSSEASGDSSTDFTEGFPLLDGYRTRNIDVRGTLKRYDLGRRDVDDPATIDEDALGGSSKARSPSSLASFSDIAGSCLDVSFGVVLGEHAGSGERNPEDIEGEGSGRDLPQNCVSKGYSLRVIPVTE